MADPPVIYLPDGVRPPDGWPEGERAGSPEALADSVVLDRSGTASGRSTAISFWGLAASIGGFVPWGTNPKARDRQLWDFAREEAYFASALGIVAGRNSAMSWSISGDEQTAQASKEMLNNANFGGGWEEFVSRVTYDLELADSGAFVELVREGESPTAESPVVAINHLDSLRCHQTGDPEKPVVYEDVEGRLHELRWYQVVQLLEVAAPRTFAPLGYAYKLQVSAATRVLRAVEILRNIEILKDERTGGRFMRTLHIVSGVDPDHIEQQMARAQIRADDQGLLRYVQPAIVTTVKPEAKVDHREIALATLPDGYDEEKALNAYILALSMGLMTDYQEFAPLPSGNIGTGQQSEILHMKARGKGPGLFRQLFLRLMNLHGVLPANVEFQWDDEDADVEQQSAETAKTRAEERQIRLEVGEITEEEARQLAMDAGDLPVEMFEAGGAEDLTTNVTVEGEEPGLRSIAASMWPDAEDALSFGEAARRAVPFGQLITSRLHRAYAQTADDAHGLGYFRTTADRKKVGGAIGPALDVFEREMRRAGVYDIEVQPEDADRLVEAGIRALAGDRAVRDTDPRRAGPDEERLEFEDEVAADVLRGLGEVRRRLVARMSNGE